MSSGDEVVPSTSGPSLAELLHTPLLSESDSQQYIDELTSLDLEALRAQPANLNTKAHHFTSSLTTLTHTSYPAFISLHSSMQDLASSLENFTTSLDALLVDSLPALESSVFAWKERTQEILTERQRARVVLGQHDKIRDLLDIPILIDTCVRNGYFSEALSLAAHATAIASAYNTKPKSLPPPILASVISEVQHSVTQMLLSLLSFLSEPNRKLPALFKAVTFIRKMDFFAEDSNSDFQSEEKIALAFLSGRETCFKSTQESAARDISRITSTGAGLDDREEEDLIRYLRKYIDLWREGVYDIVTQYSTIFLERSPYSPQAARSPSAVSPLAKQTFAGHVPWGRLHRLISTYASHALSTHLLPILSSTLPILPMSAISSFLTQLTYCSAAFAKVGLDFRSLLSPIFEHAVVSAFRRDLNRASDPWVTKVQNVSGTGLGEAARRALISPLSPSKGKSAMATITPPSKWLAHPTVVSLHPDAFTPAATAVTTPPPILTSFPPLAQLTNGILTALNGLRLLAPVSMRDVAAQELDRIIAISGKSLLEYLKAITSSSKGEGLPIKEAEQVGIVKKAAKVYFQVLAPYLRKALCEGVFASEVSLIAKETNELNGPEREWEEWRALNE